MKKFSFFAIKLIFLLSSLAVISGCKGNKNTKVLLPNVSGKAGEIVVVIERGEWEGNLGNTLRDILAGDCPYLAQREPLFTLANVPQGPQKYYHCQSEPAKCQGGHALYRE